MLPGIPFSRSDLTLKIGDPVILKRPDGSEIETIVRGLEMGSRRPSRCIPILLGKELTKEMVPVGTELWTK